MTRAEWEAEFMTWLCTYFDAPDPKHKPLAQFLAQRLHVHLAKNPPSVG